MNAVKRCLALLAATVAVGACSGDPTADLAGADLHIRATPGAVWIQTNKATNIIVEALDATGAAAPGNWTATAVGPVAVAVDDSFLLTSTGPLGNARRYIAATGNAYGNGYVIFTGTGGVDSVPVRVAPPTDAFAATFSTPSPALGATVDLTAPAGMRFTSGTAISFTKSNGLSAPQIVSMSADSTVLTFMAAPNALGRLNVSNIASTQTPTLTSNSVTVDSITAATLDTSNVPMVINNTAPTVADTVAVSVAAPFRLTAADSLPTVTPTSGGAAPIFVGFTPDSLTAKFIVPPGATGKIRFPRLVFSAGPLVGFPGRSAGTIAAAPPPPLNAVFSSSAPAANAAITITMPAGFKFRPTSVISGTAGLNFVVLSRAADSNSVSVLPLPGYSGAVKITGVRMAAAPGFSLTLNSAGTITVGATSDLGSDDPTNAGNPSFAAPSAVGGVTAWYDPETFGFADPSGAGCENQGGTGATMFYTVTVATAGSYTFTANWTSGTDIDITLMPKTGLATYSAAGCANWMSFSGASSAKPEAFTIGTLAAGTYVIYVKNYGNDVTTGDLQMQIKHN